MKETYRRFTFRPVVRRHCTSRRCKSTGQYKVGYPIETKEMVQNSPDHMFSVMKLESTAQHCRFHLPRTEQVQRGSHPVDQEDSQDKIGNKRVDQEAGYGDYRLQGNLHQMHSKRQATTLEIKLAVNDCNRSSLCNSILNRFLTEILHTLMILMAIEIRWRRATVISTDRINAKVTNTAIILRWLCSCAHKPQVQQLGKEFSKISSTDYSNMDSS